MMVQEKLDFPIKLFVYGTLKRNYPNHHYLKDCKFVHLSRAWGVLLHLGGYPGFLSETTGTSVEGEIWEIPDRDTLNRIDTLEGHPVHYTRQEVWASNSERVWTYLYTSYSRETNRGSLRGWDMILSGNWLGPKTSAVPFLGFYVDKTPPKTDGPAVAHVRIPAEFSGLLDCLNGRQVADNFRAEGKPRFVYNLQTNIWEPAEGRIKIFSGTVCDIKPDAVKTVEDWTPYMDDADPGEVRPPRNDIVKAA